MQIAIDGPAGAGKSTIAKAVAKKLGFIYVDTGAMYRALALFMKKSGILPANPEAVKKACESVEISIIYNDEGQRIILNGEDVTDLLRNEEIGKLASAFSALPFVRLRLLELQRSLGSENEAVMDGRDIGTVVLPDADLKIFLTASVEERARRRAIEIAARDGISSVDEEVQKKIAEDIRARDFADANRALAPLKMADDAYLIDSSDMTIEEVTDKIVSMAEDLRNNAN